MIQSLDDSILFLRDFHRYSAPSDPSRVPAEFPPALSTFYSELGGLLDIKPSAENNFLTPFDNQDRFASFDKIYTVDGMIVFAGENQGSWTVACSLDHSDTKVYCDAELIGGDAGFKPVCDSIDEFYHHACIARSSHGFASIAYGLMFQIWAMQSLIPSHRSG